MDSDRGKPAFSSRQSTMLPSHSFKNFARLWLPVVGWMVAIFIGSSIGTIPRVGGPTSDGIVHRVAHALEFAVLGALLLRALSRDRRITKREWIITVLVAGLYGASDEFHQRFTPGRSSEGGTVVFDVAGSLLGAWAYGMWRHRRERQSSSRLLE